MSLAGFTTPAAAGREEEDRSLMQVRLDGKALRGAKRRGREPGPAARGPGRPGRCFLGGRRAGRGRQEDERGADGRGGAGPDRPEEQDRDRGCPAYGEATAKHIHKHGGEFVLPVKENRRALFDALDALAWARVPVAHTATDKGHGRITTRTIQVLPAPDDLPFPHVSQVFLIERYVTGLHGQPISAVAALGVASPEPGRADAADLAGYVREQWSIESLHWLRDTLYQEDKSKVRTRNGPRIMAALRNLAIGALRMAGRLDITEATRWAGRSMDRPFTILGLTS